MKKTNKSFKKRLKVTKGGKVLSRKAGQNHFNAKESRRKQISQKKGKVEASGIISKKAIKEYLPHK